MIDVATEQPRHVSLPSQEFYWAVLDSSALGGRRRHAKTQLGYLFENVIPEPIEQVHATYLRIATAPSSPFLACGMSRSRLEQELARHPGAVHLEPDSLPEFVAEQLGPAIVPLQRLNLLCDHFEPPHLRRLRKGLLLRAGVLLAVSSAAVTFGFERRAGIASRQSAAAQELRIRLINDAVGAGENSLQPPEVRLIAELRRLRQSRGSSANGASASDATEQARDCTPILAAVLSHWPAQVAMMTDSIVLTPASIFIRGSTPESRDVQALADSLGGLANEHWQMQQPQMSVERDGVQATLQLTRLEAKGGSS